ncbi:hypothetical protein BGZ60DRAFT_375691 [Tricladium varicosporioides]|nr:hypothetical protein BGZ60DRAFT_375691 [Hymenoscyphus varicosporioides]
MASQNEKSGGNVLTITRPVPSRQPSTQSFDHLSTIEDVDSQHSLTPTRTSHSEKSAIMTQTSPFTDSKQDIACCACWGGLGKKQKLGIKIGSVLLIVAVIILMCVFISKAVGGGVWSKGSSNAPIKGSKS